MGLVCHLRRSLSEESRAYGFHAWEYGTHVEGHEYTRPISEVVNLVLGNGGETATGWNEAEGVKMLPV